MMRLPTHVTGFFMLACVTLLSACGAGQPGETSNASAEVEDTAVPVDSAPPGASVDPAPVETAPVETAPVEPAPVTAAPPPEVPPQVTRPPAPVPSVRPGDAIASVRPTRPTLPGPADTGAEAAAPPDEMIECAATGSTVPRATCDAYLRLRPAAGAFNVPAEIRRGDTVRIRFALSREPDAAAAKAEATAAIRGLSGEAVSIDTRSGRHMRATLGGTDGLAIKALSDERQDLGTAGIATWDWDVTANEAASLSSPELLTLTTYVELPGANGSVERLWQKVENRQIRVTVSGGQRVADAMDDSEIWIKRGNNWIIALTALIVSLSALWLAIRKFGSKG